MRMMYVPLLVCAIGLGGLVADAQQIYSSQDDGITLPTVTRQVRPHYTQAAMAAHIAGTVGLDAVVLADGTVGDVSVTEPLDSTYGLDDQAVTAMKQWLFKPGTKDDKAVAVRVAVRLRFVLK